MKKIILVMLAMLCISTIATAQRRRSLISTSTNSFYVRGYKVKDVSSEEYFEEAGDVKHGQHLRYVDGKLRAVLNWNKGKLTSVTVYYPNGKVWFKGTLGAGKIWLGSNGYFINFFRTFTRYNEKGVVEKQYNLKKIAGNWVPENYFDWNWKLKYVKKMKYDHLVFDIVDKNTGSHYEWQTWGYLAIKSSKDFKIADESDKVEIKNGVLSFELGKDYTTNDKGWVYALPKGFKGQYKLDYGFKVLRIWGAGIDSSVKTFAYDMDVVNFDNAICGEDLSIHLPTEALHNIHFPATDSNYVTTHYPVTLAAVVVKYGENEYILNLKKGDNKNGFFTYSKQDYIKDYPQENVIESEISINDSLNTDTYDSIDFTDHDIFRFKVVNGEPSFSFRFENQSVLAAKATMEYDSVNRCYALDILNGTKSLEMEDGVRKIYKYVDGDFAKGAIAYDFSKGGKVEIMGHDLNLAYASYCIAKDSVDLLQKNGCRYQGEMANSQILKLIFGNEISVSRSHPFFRGKLTLPNGTIFDGVFNGQGRRQLELFTSGLEIKNFDRGNVDIPTEYGRYIGQFSRCKASGAGKMIINNLGEVTGLFEKDKLRTDQICTVDLVFPTGEIFKGTMLYGKVDGPGELRLANGDYYIGEFKGGKFSGTGDVRYTHKNGVYEGKVNNFACQYDTPQDKKALKKVKAPKMPSIKIPSKVGKILEEKK